VRNRSAIRLAVAVLGIAIATQSSHATTKPTSWLVPQYVLRSFGDDPSARVLFAGPETYVIVRPLQIVSLPSGWRSIPTVSYRSFASMSANFTAGNAPRSGAVLYDNEKWADTPEDERADPAAYEQRAGALAHAHGLRFIATPAMDLTAALDGGPGTISTKYLRLGIARDAAKYADVIDIQAQSLEFDPSTYGAFVAAAARQARASNPHIVVVAGLTTGRNHPDGSPPTSDDLLRATAATRGSVDGYWLNVPNHGADCPQCGAFRPDIALDFLHRYNLQP
jgi:hypothetical protein